MNMNNEKSLNEHELDKLQEKEDKLWEIYVDLWDQCRKNHNFSFWQYMKLTLKSLKGKTVSNLTASSFISSVFLIMAFASPKENIVLVCIFAIIGLAFGACFALILLGNYLDVKSLFYIRSNFYENSNREFRKNDIESPLRTNFVEFAESTNDYISRHNLSYHLVKTFFKQYFDRKQWEKFTDLLSQEEKFNVKREIFQYVNYEDNNAINGLLLLHCIQYSIMEIRKKITKLEDVIKKTKEVNKKYQDEEKIKKAKETLTKEKIKKINEQIVKEFFDGKD